MIHRDISSVSSPINISKKVLYYAWINSKNYLRIMGVKFRNNGLKISKILGKFASIIGSDLVGCKERPLYTHSSTNSAKLALSQTYGMTVKTLLPTSLEDFQILNSFIN